jgi:hypothetical protein
MLQPAIRRSCDPDCERIIPILEGAGNADKEKEWEPV